MTLGLGRAQVRNEWVRSLLSKETDKNRGEDWRTSQWDCKTRCCCNRERNSSSSESYTETRQRTQQFHAWVYTQKD